MNRIEVGSSTIASIGYDPDALVLEIEFRRGAIYQYFDVPLAEYEQLMAAPSAGNYLATIIKPTYRYAKV